MNRSSLCEQCGVKLTSDRCEFATQKRIIDGKEFAFCCEKCADRYRKLTKKQE